MIACIIITSQYTLTAKTSAFMNTLNFKVIVTK